MAYFNYQLAEKKGLSARDVHLISMINQNKSEDVSRQIEAELGEDNLKRLLAFDLVTLIKGTKSQTELQKIRLTKVGKELYTNLQIPETVPNDFEMTDYIVTEYKKLDKQVKSKPNITKLIAWFRVETGMTHREIYTVLNTFVNDDEQMEYSNILDNIFWKRPHMFAVHKNIEDSRLYAYYTHRKAFFDNKFEKLNK